MKTSILSTYKVWESLNTKFFKILFEITVMIITHELLLRIIYAWYDWYVISIISNILPILFRNYIMN